MDLFTCDLNVQFHVRYQSELLTNSIELASIPLKNIGMTEFVQ